MSLFERIKALKEMVEPFDVPRSFKPIGYWCPCMVRPNPADDDSNHHPLDPDAD